jgi:hypothetical protein
MNLLTVGTEMTIRGKGFQIAERLVSREFGTVAYRMTSDEGREWWLSPQEGGFSVLSRKGQRWTVEAEEISLG